MSGIGSFGFNSSIPGIWSAGVDIQLPSSAGSNTPGEFSIPSGISTSASPDPYGGS